MNEKLKLCQTCLEIPTVMTSREVFKLSAKIPIKYAVFCNCQQWHDKPERAIELWNKRHE